LHDFYNHNLSTTTISQVFPCPLGKRFSLLDISCNFEEGYLCPQFRQSASDDFDWSIGWGETPTAGTGPDEAASGNKYLFIEASSRQPLQNAKLETQIIPANCK